jgi:hypothetical protein
MSFSGVYNIQSIITFREFEKTIAKKCLKWLYVSEGLFDVDIIV